MTLASQASGQEGPVQDNQPDTVDGGADTAATHGPATQVKGWQATLSRTAGLGLSAPFILISATFIVYPFLRLLVTAAGEPNGFGNFADFMRNKAAVRTLIFTCVDSLLVTIVTVAFGAMLAWALRTLRSRAIRLVILAAVFLPLWMGAVVKIYAFSVLLGRFGVVNRLLESAGFIEEPAKLLYTQLAVILGMTYQMLPYAVLPLYAVFTTIDLNLVAAAEGLGASRMRALGSVVVPLASPGILATAIIVYVISIGFYLTPVLLGGASAPFTASLVAEDIFTYNNMAEAAVSSVLLLLVSLLVIGAAARAVGRERLRRALG